MKIIIIKRKSDLFFGMFNKKCILYDEEDCPGVRTANRVAGVPVQYLGVGTRGFMTSMVYVAVMGRMYFMFHDK